MEPTIYRTDNGDLCIDFHDRHSYLLIGRRKGEGIICGYVDRGPKWSTQSNWLGLLVTLGISKQMVADVHELHASATVALEYFEGKITREQFKVRCRQYGGSGVDDGW